MLKITGQSRSPVCLKVIEHIVHSQISRFLDDHHIPISMVFVMVALVKHSFFQLYMIGLPGLTVVFLQTLQFSTSARRSTRFRTKGYYTSLIIMAFVATY